MSRAYLKNLLLMSRVSGLYKANIRLVKISYDHFARVFVGNSLAMFGERVRPYLTYICNVVSINAGQIAYVRWLSFLFVEFCHFGCFHPCLFTFLMYIP